MSKMKKIFIIEIEIEDNAWFVLKGRKPLYTKGQRILIPVRSSSAYHAEMKFSTICQGSEFPNYRIISMSKCDDKGFFAPII